MGKEQEMVMVFQEEKKKIVLNKFSKALSPTGVDCTDNSWAFWVVTSLGSHSGRVDHLSASGLPDLNTVILAALELFYDELICLDEILTRCREGNILLFLVFYFFSLSVCGRCFWYTANTCDNSREHTAKKLRGLI